MKILHISHQYPPDHIGGVELNTRALTRAQAAAGHEVALFFRRSRAGTGLDQWKDEGTTVWAAWSGEVAPTGRFLSTFRDPAMALLLEKVLDSFQPELVHIQHLMGLPLSLLSVIEERSIPFVVTLHDYWWICANAQLLTNDTSELCEGPELWINCGRCALARAGRGDLPWLAPAIAPLFAYRNHALKRIAERASALIAPTAFTADLYARLGLPGDRISVIPHGIELQSLPHHRPSHPEEGSALRIVYVGGIAPQKGVHSLIEAVNGLPVEGVELSIFGDGTAFPDYTSELQRLVTHPAIRFEGTIANETLLSRLAGFDVLVVPSLWYETAALVIQEAFAAGVPVIASELGALQERVRPEIDGLLAPPGDATALRALLLRLKDEPGLKARLRAGIRPVRTTVEQHRDTFDLYTKVLAARGHP